MPGERPSKADLSIEDLFAEAVAAVESISSEVELEVTPGDDAEASIEIDIGADIGADAVDLSALLTPEISEAESRALEKRAARKAKLKNRIADLESARDEAQEASRALRAEGIRLKASNQRLRERLDRLQSQNDNLEDARQSAEQQVVRFRDAYRKSTRDLQHFQERRRQEQLDLKLHGQSPSILAVLPVLDHLQMAIDHASAEPQQIVSGIEMVISQFHGVLRRLGVKRVEASPGTPFQPELHEAMLYTPTAEIPAGHILQEISTGYELNGRLIRAARVSVAANVSEEEPDEELLSAEAPALPDEEMLARPEEHPAPSSECSEE